MLKFNLEGTHRSYRHAYVHVYRSWHLYAERKYRRDNNDDLPGVLFFFSKYTLYSMITP
jgi:hypothetical protein